MGENTRRNKHRKTIEQKRRSRAIAIVSSLVFLVIFAVLFSALSGASQISVNELLNDRDYSAVDYTGIERPLPYLDEDGYWTFDEPKDRDFKLLHLTDIHIGAGFASSQKDIWAMNAVATMVSVEKPDLVIITGDIAYPFYFQSGTINNLNAIKIFGELMTNLGVYWTFVFGNHDTESYGTHTRAQVCEFLEEEIENRPDDFGKYCLFQTGPSNISGYGNHFIKIKNSDGYITQALGLIDSHTYLDDDVFGFLWHYDSIHEDQMNWFNTEMAKFEYQNQLHHEKTGLPAAEPIFGSMFIHIPIEEYREAYALGNNENHEPGYSKSSDDATMEIISGKVGKKYPYCFSGKNGCNTFEKCVPHGLRAVFCGHDHYNNIMMKYKKKINYGTLDSPDIRMSDEVMLCYASSIDYLASPGIWQLREQRGCNVINIKGNTMNPIGKNYYSDEYKEMREKIGTDEATKLNKYDAEKPHTV